MDSPRKFRTHSASGTPRLGRGAFSTPKKRARSRSGGRRKSFEPSPTQKRELKRISASTTLHARSAAGVTNSINSMKKAMTEQARVAKEARWGTQGGLRATRVEYHRMEVPVKAERKSVSRIQVSRAVENLISDDDATWLRSFIRENAVAKDRTLFLADFCKAFNEQRKKKVSESQMSQLLHMLGFGYVRLKPGYYDAAWSDAWNLERQRLVAPVLWLLLRWPGNQIVVWNFDEAAFHVSDFHQYGWADLADPSSQRKPHLKTGREGLRMNVSAFISREFGVLKTSDGRHVGAFERGTTNDADSTAELFGFAGQVMAVRWPEKLHVIVTDGPRIHTMLDVKACNPNVINKSDGGSDRGFDDIFGDRGLDWIYGEHFQEQDKLTWTVKQLRQDLWSRPEVSLQSLRLERILHEHDILLLLNPVAHPQFAPIELLWRDIKWDYRVCWEKSILQLEECISRWLDSDGDDAEGYFKTVEAFVGYFMHGGKGRITEYKVKRMFERNFEDLDDSSSTRDANMRKLYESLPGLKRKPKKKVAMTKMELVSCFKKYFHELNWMRKRKAIDLEENNQPDLDDDSE